MEDPMRKNIFQIGLAIIGTWALMFLAWFAQMNYTAATHNDVPAGALSVGIMLLVLGAGAVTTIIGYTLKP